jgi:magnesium-transporting ATPase (P-type)
MRSPLAGFGSSPSPAGRPASSEPASAGTAEAGLTLYGLLGLEDPPRDDVGDAIASCRRAGVKIAMITGDHPVTAAAIADEVGLREPDDPVLVGHELPADDEALGALLDHDGVVVARVTPRTSCASPGRCAREATSWP